MDSIINKFKNIKPKTIKALSVIALIFAIFNGLSYFIVYTYGSHWQDGPELHFYLPSLSQIFSMLIMIAPYILLVIYLFKFHEQNKATAIVPVVFGLVAFGELFNIINIIIGYYYSNVLDAILSSALLITFALATYSALNGLSNKLFVLIPTSIGLLVTLVDVIYSIQNTIYFIEEGMEFFIFTYFAYVASSVLLYITLLLFGMKYNVPSLMGKNRAPKDIKLDYIEEELKILNEKLELGIISQEEYQARKMNILDRL